MKLNLGKKKANSEEKITAKNSSLAQTQENDDDPELDYLILVILVIFLLAAIFVPQEWFLKCSIWWNSLR